MKKEQRDKRHQAGVSPEEPPNQHNTAAMQEEPEDEKVVNFSYFTRTHCVTNGKENQLSDKIRFFR